jgi:WD40 repeat protein
MPPCEGEPALVGTSRLENIALSSDDRYLAVGQFDCVFIVEAATFRRVASLRLRLGLPKSMVFRKDGVLIVATNDSSEAGGRFRLQAWDWRAKTTLANIYPEAENQSPTRLEPVLTITADGKKIGILSYRSGLPGTLSIWDSYLQKELGRLPVGDSTAVALNQDGSRAVTVSRQTPTVQVWDTGRATVLLTLTDTDGHLGGVAFASTGQIIAGRSSGGITIYDPRYQSRPTSR